MSNTTFDSPSGKPYNRPSFQQSLETQLLIRRLRQCQIGEIVEYSELLKLIGSTHLGKSRSAIVTARRNLMKNHRIIFGAINKVGLKRLNDEEIVSLGTSRIHHIYRTARRSLAEQDQVLILNLNPEQRIRHAVNLTLSNAAMKLADHERTGKMMKLMSAQKQPLYLAFEQTLEWLKNGK